MQITTSTDHQSYDEFTGLRTTSDRGYNVDPCEGREGCTEEATLKVKAFDGAGHYINRTDFVTCRFHLEEAKELSTEEATYAWLTPEIRVEPYQQDHTEHWINIRQEQVR